MEGLAGKLRRTLGLGAAHVEPPGQVRLVTGNPSDFWSGFLAGLESGRDIVLMDPAWPPEWRTRLEKQLKNLGDDGRRILIPTSGSSGLPRFCIHKSDTLCAAAAGFAERFGPSGLRHAVSVLPQHHVGGLMTVFRSAACGGRTHFADYRKASSLMSAPFPLAESSISLVPTQLGRMMEKTELTRALGEFGLILVGGSGCPENLLASAREKGLRLAPCYGSTETAAMVTVLDPDDFLRGAEGVGTALPHVRLETGPAGQIAVSSPANLLGYFPQRDGFCRQPWPTGDLGHIDERGCLHIHGRADRMIITGGENVHPEQVEAAALASGLVADAFCFGEENPDWGERVVLMVVARYPSLEEHNLQNYLQEHLPRYAVPKKVSLCGRIPRNELGKLRSSGPENHEDRFSQ